MKYCNSAIACLLAVLFPLSLSAQSSGSTFTTVQSILQANCSAAGCHGGGDARIFDVDASPADLYNALVNVPAVNPVAAAKGNLLVDPGHPYNSFLLRKTAGNSFDPFIQIEETERSSHPALTLPDYDIELIRQWILAGAQETGAVVNYQLLKDYYNNGGLDFIPVPQAPDAGKGFQVRMGPIFLAPNDEAEYMKKEHLKNPGTLIVSEMAAKMSWESHHLLLFKFNGSGSGEREGLRKVPFQAFPFNGNAYLTGAWQNDGDYKLPEGTAYYWTPGAVLDFDFHVKNYSQTEILPADFYLNVYYNQETTPPIEMYSELQNEIALALNPGENFESRTDNFNEDRYIYMLSSHTHKYGTDYDIFIRNPDGTKGDQIYEGFYDEEYRFNQGYYDYQHPPIRYFPNLLKVSHGLIFETRWNITGPCTSPLQPLFCITFGMTTDDEMMLFYYNYTTEPLKTATGIKPEEATGSLSVYPNPVSEASRITYHLEQAASVKVEVVDVTGKRLETVTEENQYAGNHALTVGMALTGKAPGIYFLTLTANGNKVSTAKITKL